MSTQAEQSPRAASEASPGNGAGASPIASRLDSLRRRREQIARDKTLLLQVEAYEGELWVRYKAVPGEEITQLAEKMERSREATKQLDVAADVLIRCCDAILVKPEGEKEPQEIPGVTFSSGGLCAMLFGEENGVSSAREEVFGVFSPDGAQPLAVNSHGIAVINWLQGKLSEIDEALLGE